MSKNGNNPKQTTQIPMGHDLPPVSVEIIPDGDTLIVDLVLGNMKWTVYMNRETVKGLGEYLIKQAGQ
ncbi:MAG TPA: hypothetical protein VGR34_06355 [Candidatus Dormibacteraeota bacterium]|nr:hypothetical protein [Candidatus Dormibacteraeota bacterium]